LAALLIARTAVALGSRRVKTLRATATRNAETQEATASVWAVLCFVAFLGKQRRANHLLKTHITGRGFFRRILLSQEAVWGLATTRLGGIKMGH
jgi:hypothetical protein